MPLTTCPDCGRSVSASAVNCPNCGRPMKPDSLADPHIHGRGEGLFMKILNCGCFALLAFVALIVAVAVLNSP